VIDRDYVLKIIRRALSERDIAVPALDFDTALRSLGIDSLGFVEIIFEIEVALEIELDEELLQEVETIGDVVAIVAGARA
jgi:acyl carrier protein